MLLLLLPAAPAVPDPNAHPNPQPNQPLGIAPFITRRGLGVATGLIGAGGESSRAFFCSALYPPLPAASFTPVCPPPYLPSHLALPPTLCPSGNTGSAITQAIFFTGAGMTTSEGFKWMGVMILAITGESLPASLHASGAAWQLSVAPSRPRCTVPPTQHPPTHPFAPLTLCFAATLVFLHFPMWGGMLTRGNPAITEEEYYRCVCGRVQGGMW